MALRPLIAIGLALMIAFTSGAMAAARGETGPAGSMVICTGFTFTTIQVDADGQPVSAVHICPDCALSLFDNASTAEPLPAVLLLTSDAVFEDATAPVPPLLAVQAARARAPPAV